MIATDTARRRAVAGPLHILEGRPGRLVVGLGAIAVGLISLRISDASLGFSYLAESAVSAVIGLAAGWGLVAVGLETARRGRRRRLGYLLAAAGIAWFLPEWADPASGAALVFTTGLALAWLYPAVVGHALVAIAGPSRPRDVRRFVALGYVVFVIGLGVLPALGFDPRTAGCGFCPPDLIGIGGPPAVFDAAVWVATVLAAAWTLAAAAFLATSLARSGAMAREVLAPTLIPGIVLLVLVGVALGRAIVAAVPPTDPTDRLLRLSQGIALVALATGVAFEWARARRSRTRVARVVADLAGSPAVGGLRDHLAAILRDPKLQLAYPIGSGALVDAHGRELELPARDGRSTTPIIRDGNVVALIEHDVHVLEDPAGVDEVLAAARLGIEYERLQADSSAQLVALRAARRRIVQAGDVRRKQLERDLHDGAQQQLIALSIGLRFVDRDPGTKAWIEEAAAELRLSMDDLREVAHGIYPSVLGDEGFASAVDAVAEASTVPVTIVEMVGERFDQAVEVAAYHAVADIVRGGGGPFRIRARRGEERLTVEVTASEIPEQIAEYVADRVGAVDGSVEIVRSGTGSTTLTAAIPMGRS